MSTENLQSSNTNASQPKLKRKYRFGADEFELDDYIYNLNSNVKDYLNHQ